VAALEAVWSPLDGLNLADKELLVQSLVTVTSHDGELTVSEVELLRTICAVLHCPLPPGAEPGAGRGPADLEGNLPGVADSGREHS
jgi:hypothetical protein